MLKSKIHCTYIRNLNSLIEIGNTLKNSKMRLHKDFSHIMKNEVAVINTYACNLTSEIRHMQYWGGGHCDLVICTRIAPRSGWEI